MTSRQESFLGNMRALNAKRGLPLNQVSSYPLESTEDLWLKYHLSVECLTQSQRGDIRSIECQASRDRPSIHLSLNKTGLTAIYVV